FRADYGFVATVDREIMRDPEREVSYGITDLWDEIVETLQGAPGQQGLAEDPTQPELPEEAGGRVVRFGKRGKLNPKYVGPFKVLEVIGKVAYKLELPEELSRVHNTFHVSNLKKCHADEPLAVPLDELQFDDKLHFIEEPVEILDREVKRLKQSQIPLVK
nr:putative reverse transcriptase domain-containing protein [Tanacetum cinerariifolium]